MFITSPEAFAEYFNTKIPDVYRKITVDDVRLMTECGLVGRYNYYIRQDLETVRGVLMYEQMREKLPEKQEKRPVEKSNDVERSVTQCKSCSRPLPPEFDGKKGRRKEYCPECEPSRNRERQKKLRRRNQYSALM
jgi:hypothetical protein